MIRKASERRICVFCKLDHRVYTKKEVSFLDVIVLLVVTGVMAFAIWGGPDLRSMLIFMSLAFVLQVFLRVRYRESVKCPHCGFDPILYRNNNEDAAQKVKTFMENRADNPQYMLKPRPRIKALIRKSDDPEASKELTPAPEPEEPFPEPVSPPNDLIF